MAHNLRQLTALAMTERPYPERRRRTSGVRESAPAQYGSAFSPEHIRKGLPVRALDHLAQLLQVTDPLDLRDLTACRARGERFLEAGRACALRVSSVVLPEETNYLVNAGHPDAAKIRLVSERSFLFDERRIA